MEIRFKGQGSTSDRHSAQGKRILFLKYSLGKGFSSYCNYTYNLLKPLLYEAYRI